MKNNQSKANKFILFVFAVILMGFSGFALFALKNKDNEIHLQEINIQDKNIKIEELQSKYQKVVEELEQSNLQNSDRIKQLEDEKTELEKQLQAKIEQKEKLAKAAQGKTTSATTQVNFNNETCKAWMQQAGITDMNNAYILIMRESSCNPNAVNKSSGACGIGQQLPCGKWEHQWNDPVGAMVDMQKYVFNRYGSWANAVAFHNSKGWY